VSDDRFKMLYCDTNSCRVNTFEAGIGDPTIPYRHGDGSVTTRTEPGLCPGCGEPGKDLETHETWEAPDE
jgi:hypothetical protein